MPQLTGKSTFRIVLAIYALGLTAGVQIALYLSDFYDDGPTRQ